MVTHRVDGPHVYGIHYYEAMLGCIARSLFEQDTDDEGGEAAQFGTTMHEWLAAYHGGAAELPSLDPTPIPRFCSLADLGKRYARRYSRDIFGRVVLVEERLRMELEVAPGITEPYAGTLDLVTEMGPEHCLALKALSGLDLVPGYYQVDHKTKAQANATLYTQMSVRPQFTGGYHLWDFYRHGRNLPALQGTIANILMRYVGERPDQFKTFFIPPPNAQATAVLKHIVRTGAERRRTLGDTFVDPTRCFDYHRECPKFLQCERYV